MMCLLALRAKTAIRLVFFGMIVGDLWVVEEGLGEILVDLEVVFAGSGAVLVAHEQVSGRLWLMT